MEAPSGRKVNKPTLEILIKTKIWYTTFVGKSNTSHKLVFNKYGWLMMKDKERYLIQGNQVMLVLLPLDRKSIHFIYF